MNYRVKKHFKYVVKYDMNYMYMRYKKIILKNDLFYIDAYRYNKLKNSINNTSISKIRNRCIINGRARSVYRKYKLSRHIFKEYSSAGLLNGIRKKQS